MEKVLVLLHAPAGDLEAPAREVLAGALELAGGPEALTVGLVGTGAAQAAARIGGVGARLLAVTGPDFDVPRYASDAAALEALVRASGATLVLAPATSRMARALPGTAARVGGRIDTRVTGLSAAGGALRAQRWHYRQRMMATFSRSGRPWFLIMESGIWAPWSGPAAPAPLTEVSVAAPAAGWRTSTVGEEAASSGAATIRPDAPVLLVAGAGWTKAQKDGKAHVREAEDLIRNFLEMTQASLGSSKSLVDQSAEGGDVISFMTHLNQVGQTGATPRHKKGLSTCCHGEEPHVVGWRFVAERRAVNLDPNCGWARGKADVVYVADAFQVMARVNALLAE